ncbi:S1 RNA-binding domain-containing protein [uncultured Duncaniella sp.]|nr:S1 RNA-binding domain-containing protein [uncultured Duncaniella sp.]
MSQLSDKYVSSPSELVSIGQRIKVKVIDIDVARGRIALTIKGVSQS